MRRIVIDKTAPLGCYSVCIPGRHRNRKTVGRLGVCVLVWTLFAFEAEIAFI